MFPLESGSECGEKALGGCLVGRGRLAAGTPTLQCETAEPRGDASLQGRAGRGTAPSTAPRLPCSTVAFQTPFLFGACIAFCVVDEEMPVRSMKGFFCC